MKKRGILSVLIIVLAIAAVGGATMAWFTDQSDPLENVFTAGTVSIEAGEEWAYEGDTKENWNPGDCDDKEFTITNTGSKGIKIRGIMSANWYDADGVTPWAEADPDAVTIDFSDSVGVDNTGWTIEYDDVEEVWYLYYEPRIPGTFEEPDPDDLEATVTIKVCLIGNIAGNEYQGKVFKLETIFQAIQASHEGGPDGWDWNDDINFETGLIE